MMTSPFVSSPSSSSSRAGFSCFPQKTLSREVLDLRPNDVAMLVDCGGGTVDIVTHVNEARFESALTAGESKKEALLPCLLLSVQES